MKILVIGSGGREHAIIWAISKNQDVKKIYCANGNAGISSLAECVDISPTDINELAGFALEKQIDLTFVGGETSLAMGIVDEFEKRSLQIIGVSKKAARLEASKSFAKDFMSRHKIPTAIYETVGSTREATEVLKTGKFGGPENPVVVKADGLAAGKGVVVASNHGEALEALEAMKGGELIDKRAAEQIVLEECLVGREISLLLFSDGRKFALMPPTRDHKRIGENDTGPNTGGMGTITDPGLLTKEQTEIIKKEIIEPTLAGARKDGFPIKGILFLGLMMTETGAKVLEYNVRFGDPETQAILVTLETDFIEICKAIQNQALENKVISWRGGSSACIILAAENYPANPRKGDRIIGLEEAVKMENVVVFHSGTSFNESGDLVTGGGRVLGVTSIASNLSNSLHRAYKAVNEISWEGMQFRRDIGK